MALIEKNCLNCNKEFSARSQDVNRGFGKFCSQSCSSTYNRAHEIKPQSNVICAWCNKEFYKNTSKQTGSKSGLYFCCREHKDAAQRIGGIRAIMPSHFGETQQNYRDIVFKINKREKKCERCGFDKHEAAIIVHHKDRNRSNNDIANLEVLCANCHAIEHWGDR